MPHHRTGPAALQAARAQTEPHGEGGRVEAAGLPSEWDPYDLYLSGFRSAFLGAEAGVREVPSPRGRAAFALGLRDGETRADAPKSRRQLLALLERLAP